MDFNEFAKGFYLELEMEIKRKAYIQKFERKNIMSKATDFMTKEQISSFVRLKRKGLS